MQAHRHNRPSSNPSPASVAFISSSPLSSAFAGVAAPGSSPWSRPVEATPLSQRGTSLCPVSATVSLPSPTSMRRRVRGLFFDQPAASGGAPCVRQSGGVQDKLKRLTSQLSFSARPFTPGVDRKLVARTAPRKPINWQRLNSKEDRRWFHKLSSLVFLFSSIVIMALLPIRAAIFHDFSMPPAPLLHPLLWMWAPSCVVQAVTGGLMAIKYRRYEPKSRDVFLNNSAMTLVNVWVVLKLCLPLPAPFSSDLLSQLIMGVLTVVVVAMSLVSVYHAPTLISNRNKQVQALYTSKQEADEADASEKKSTWLSIPWILDYVNYIFPFFYPLPFIIGSFFFFVNHDHAWILDKCNAFPHVRSIALYVNVAAAFTIGMISLAVTLRDRKIVSKRAESVTISLISIFLAIFMFETFRLLVGFQSLTVIFPWMFH